MKKINPLSRREFLGRSAVGAIGAVTLPGIITSCSSQGDAKKSLNQVEIPELLAAAPDGKPLKAGLIGCGGRGSGAASNFLEAGPNLQIVALGDLFADRLNSCRQALKEKGQEIADDKCFLGFDAWQKVIDAGVDVVLLCTPPVFRAAQFEAAINAGKHVFMEKPCAVDPVGARTILIASKKAEQNGLCVVSGTIRRSQKDCVETYRRVAEGAIGDIVSAHVIRNGGALWHRKRQPEWTDMEYMVRNWVNFCWLSGDHIVEQFVHEIDQMSWFVGKRPVKAIGYGGRHRRVTGDQFDFFSIEYAYESGMRAHCSARQISGCGNAHNVMVYGTKGYTNCFDTIFNLDGTVAWKYPTPKPEDPDQTWAVKDPFVQEHIRWVTAIRTGKYLNDAEAHVQSTLMAIMGRMAAYTGKDITWEEIMASTLKLGPETYEMGAVPGIEEVIPVAGTPVA